MFLDQLNARLNIQKAVSISPSEKIFKAIESDLALSLVQKDWAKWNQEHPHGSYASLLPKRDLNNWKLEAEHHKSFYNKHLEMAGHHPSGSPARLAHSNAAISHLNAKEHAEGVLAGTHDPAKYNIKNKRAIQDGHTAFELARQKPTTQNPNHGTRGMFANSSSQRPRSSLIKGIPLEIGGVCLICLQKYLKM